MKLLPNRIAWLGINKNKDENSVEDNLVMFKTQMRQWEIPVGTINEKVIRCFTNGHCPTFALAVNKLTGWPIYVLEADMGAGHAYCVDPNGRAVDIEGFKDEKEFLRSWKIRISSTNKNVKEFYDVYEVDPENNDFALWVDSPKNLEVDKATSFAELVLSEAALRKV